MKRVISKGAMLLFALTLGYGMAYGAMGEQCGNGKAPVEKSGTGKCGSGDKSAKADHCGSAKCGEAKAKFQKMHCGSGKSAADKSDAKCGKGKCG